MNKDHGASALSLCQARCQKLELGVKQLNVELKELNLELDRLEQERDSARLGFDKMVVIMTIIATRLGKRGMEPFAQDALEQALGNAESELRAMRDKLVEGRSTMDQIVNPALEMVRRAVRDIQRAIGHFRFGR